MRPTPYVLSALLLLAAIGTAAAAAVDVPTEMPETELIACLTLGIPFQVCYQIYIVCINILRFIPGATILCFYA